MLIFLIFLLYVCSCVISIPIVKRRWLLAKRLIIGKETGENIDKLKQIATNYYNNGYIEKEFVKESYKVELEVDDGKIIKVRVVTKKADVIYSGKEYTEINKAFSERGAIMYTGLWILLFLILLLLFFCLLSLT